mmetsp:Transcript_11909/g.34885  ORF Transcript_11909/g.34885 Transcript_11909/m.34885 type:complete len:618 (-) Transcript_11909:138-1991(-)
MMSPANQSSGESSEETRRAPPSLLQVVQGLEPDVDPSARSIALAIRHFNHNDASLHDYEISQGSAYFLCNLLDRALMGSDTSVLVTTEGNDSTGGGGAVGGNLYRWRSARIAMTCSALEMTLRCATATLRSCFRQMGSHALMPAIICALEEFATCSDSHTNAARLVLRSCSKVLRRISDAGIVLVSSHTEVRILLSLLIRIVQSDVSAGIDGDTFATIANLTNISTNRTVMTTSPGLLDILLTSSRSSGRRQHCACEAARALQHLSRCEQSCRVMGSRGDVVENLSTWIEDSRATVRRFAVAAVRNLTTRPPSEVILAVHQKKQLLKALLGSIQKGIDAATANCRRQAMQGLLNTEKPSTVAECITEVVRESLQANTDAVSNNIEWRDAMSALMEPVGYLQLSDLSIKARCDLLDSLLDLSQQSFFPEVTNTLELLSRKPQNQSAMAYASGMLCVLARLLREDNGSIVETSMACAKNLFLEPESSAKLWDGDGQDLLEAFMDILCGAVEVSERACGLCVQTIANLVAHSESNRKRLGRYSSLVPSLVHFASSASPSSSKDAAVRSIVQLSCQSLADRGGNNLSAEERMARSFADVGNEDDDTEWIDFAPDMFLEVEI